MGTREDRSVLLVPGAGVDAEAAESTFAEAPFSSTILPTLPDIFDRLTNEVHHCLVLPERVGEQAGTDIAYGVRKLFPELPIVLVGVEPSTVPDELDVTALPHTSLRDPDVVDTVRGVLDDDAPSVAGREPSPMETLLLSLFDEMPDHLYAKDDAARHVMMGRGFNQPTDRIGLTDTEVGELVDEHAEAAYRDEMAILDGETDRIEVEEFLDLTAEYVLTKKVPWYDSDGNIRGLVGLTQDITDRKAREHDTRRQHERMVKVALLAAHKFRNELQIAHGRLELLDCDAEELTLVEESLSRISAVVDTVVTLSTQETDVSDRKPVWLSRLSREVWDTLAESQAELRIEDDARLVADQESAGLLMQFLFQNALEHVGPSVTVTVGSTPEGFSVADDGPGSEIDPPERVFDAGYTTVEGNTGFGLYIARMVAEDHGWEIELSESSDGGMRFDVVNVDLHD
ncbi:sensor histidine kinase [Haloarcula pelagica]|uniref:sensor histidine kinase n=1 Tax=Haloarcula pelagica TaxID=3033389 RepID=UPI0024C45FC5|nr:HAMP domain-containing sensor histidine kinase [Halomicroarcula sp. YJ-61-S]